MKKILVILTILVVIGGPLAYFMAKIFNPTRLVSPPASPERFPILSRFELPRNYGYFIGDEIPLTLIIETTGGVVLDLVNLPQKGEEHGLFEIRNLTITSSRVSREKKIYRAAYTLQYFGPTPVTTHFGALEILYALPTDKDALTNTYTYQSLFTQPVSINIARIGPYQSPQPLQIVGTVYDQRSGLIWTTFTLGTVCVLVSLGGWGREWWKKRQRQNAPRVLTAADQALQKLQNDEALFFPPAAEPPFSMRVRLAQILREYLHAECHVPAFTFTTAELTTCLNGVPLSEEILHMLERCDDLKYRSPSDFSAEERELWWKAMALFTKLRKE